MRRIALGLAVLAGLMSGAPASATGPAVLASPAEPGPDVAPGVSLLEEIFPDGLPFPFAAVIERLRREAGAQNVATALIPLGRSLQRYGAAPDFFGSPRVMVAVTGDDAAGPGDVRLADRLFLGYQPAAAIIEAITWNPKAGRFEFREVVGYAEGSGAIEPAERQTCIACHQGHGPIFARPLWSESNANPAVVARLAALGAEYQGAPVRQSVDTLEAFDAATDRAARVVLADELWSEGCTDAACRAALLVAALRIGLGAAAGEPETDFGTGWPEGLAAVSPDLPTYDPLRRLAETDAAATLETSGALNPETPRPAVTLWRARPGGFAAAASVIAAQLAPGDFAWIDGRLAPGSGAGETRSLACETRTVDMAAGAETRFSCAERDGEAQGFVGAGGTGRIESLRLRGEAPLGHMAVRAIHEDGTTRMRATGRAARLRDGRRVAEFVLADGRVAVRLSDDIGPLAEGLAARAREGATALGPGPFDRRAVLELIEELTGGS
jgi:hypothetical protein